MNDHTFKAGDCAPLVYKDGSVNLGEVSRRLENPVTKTIISTIVEKGYMDEDEYIDQLVSVGNVLNSGKWKIADFLAAVEFTSYRLAGDSQVKAYTKAFPDRCLGKTDGAIAGKASIYSHGSLVVQMLGMTQVPLHMLYMRERHIAIRKLAELSQFGETERIQMESSDKLLGHIKPPEEIKVELDVGVGAVDVINDFNETLNNIAEMAKAKLDDGTIDARQLIQR